MKDLFLRIIMIIFCIFFAIFLVDSILHFPILNPPYNKYDAISDSRFLVSLAFAGVFLTLTLTSFYIERVYVDKQKNTNISLLKINIILSVVFFLLGLYGFLYYIKFNNRNLYVLIPSILLLCNIFVNLGLISFRKENDKG